jgi:hypothetical protein
MATLPGGVDHRGGHSGKVLGLEVAWGFDNCSPESDWQTARSGRGRSRRPGTRSGETRCQGKPSRLKGVGRNRGRLRGKRSSPEFEDLASGSGGTAGSHWRSLAALGFRKRRRSGEGVEGVIYVQTR